MQRTLFPRVRPVLRTVDVAGVCRPASVVGGDYFDYIPIDGGRVALVVADVAGKGMPAALLGILAVGAYWFARRRRTVSVRHIQIVETASLGPKRSLVVARVGEETLILGTSEAGITLLKNSAGQGGGLAGVTHAPSLGALETAIGAGATSGVWSFALKPQGASYEVVDLHPFAWQVLATDVDFGPDGGLYISDWVHGWNVTGKGRVYRLADAARTFHPWAHSARTPSSPSRDA